jgi:hypothetical protein
VGLVVERLGPGLEQDLSGDGVDRGRGVVGHHVLIRKSREEEAALLTDRASGGNETASPVAARIVAVFNGQKF